MPANKPVYLDNAATTPLDPRVLKAMEPYLTSHFGNASSLHYAGNEARKAVDRARSSVAKFLSCQPAEVFFTSGATESDNMAVFGRLPSFEKANQVRPHVIVSAIEHDAVLEPAQKLAKDGFEVTFIKPGTDGIVSAEEVGKAIRLETALVSVMYANNEIGTIQPIAEIGAIVAQANAKRPASARIIFHTDATQAAAYLPMDVNKLGVDMLSFSGHKIYGPNGVGVLYLKKGTPFEPQTHGGHQQSGVRPGTYNVPAIVGLGRAVELVSDKKATTVENKRIKELRDKLVKGIKAKVKRIHINGDMKKRLPSNASIIFEGAEGESILLMLSQQNIAVSTGSACSSGSLEASHVLKAIGVKPELSHGSVRFSLGRFNKPQDIDRILKVLPEAVEKLRRMSPLK